MKPAARHLASILMATIGGTLGVSAAAATPAAAVESVIKAVRLGGEPAVGVPFVVEYTLDGPAGASIVTPALPPSDGPFDVIDVRLRGSRTLAVTYVTWSSEEASIPSVGVTVLEADGSSHAAALPTVPVSAASTLADDDSLLEMGKHLGHLANPGEFPLRLVAASLSAAAIAGCAAAAWMLRRRPVRVPTPEEIALDGLDRLEARELSSSDDAEPFWFDVTDILRQYIGARFGLLAPTLTTREFLAEARDRLPVSQDQKDRLRILLDHADRIKFARQCSTAEDGRKALQFVRRFVVTHAPATGPTNVGAGDAGVGATAGSEASTC